MSQACSGEAYIVTRTKIYSIFNIFTDLKSLEFEITTVRLVTGCYVGADVKSSLNQGSFFQMLSLSMQLSFMVISRTSRLLRANFMGELLQIRRNFGFPVGPVEHRMGGKWG